MISDRKRKGTRNQKDIQASRSFGETGNNKLDDPDCAAISNKLLHSEKSVAMLPIFR